MISGIQRSPEKCRKKCFICNDEIMEDEIFTLTPDESSFTFTQILDLPDWHVRSDLKKMMFQFQFVCYCSDCIGPILVIWKLETQGNNPKKSPLKILNKKFQIVIKLVETCQKMRGSCCDQPIGMLQKLRIEIVDEILKNDTLLRLLDDLRCRVIEIMPPSWGDIPTSKLPNVSIPICPWTMNEINRKLGEKELNALRSRTRRKTDIVKSPRATEKLKLTPEESDISENDTQIPISKVETSSESLADSVSRNPEPNQTQTSKSQTLQLNTKTSSTKILGKNYNITKKPFACTICKKVFSSDRRRNDHLKTFHLNQGKHSCPIRTCNFSGSNFRVVRVHLITTHAKIQICPICFKRDLKTHSCESRFRCKPNYTTGSNQPNQCEFCGLILSSYNAWKRHMSRSLHRDDDEENWILHKCTLCDFKTQYPNNLKHHIARHKERRNFK